MNHEQADIVIIGAGVAGLAAARVLAPTGLTLQVLEARNRIGGRIFTRHDPALPIPIDLGAEFIHGTPAELWQIINAAGLPIHAITGASYWKRHGMLAPAAQIWEQVDTIFSYLDQRAGQDISFDAFLATLQLDPTVWGEAQELATAFVEGFNAARSDRISIQTLGGDTQEGEQFRVLSGYDQVVHWLQTGINPANAVIHCNTIVSSIEWRQGTVEVQAHSSTGKPLAPFRAKCAIITLPLGVLQATGDQVGSVQFIPLLAEKRAAAQRIEMGQVLKIILRFRERFWENTSPQQNGDPHALTQVKFLHAPTAAIPTWWTAHPILVPLLTGWAGGPAATRLTNLDEPELLDQALDSLALLFGHNRQVLEGLLSAWYVHNWQTDPFSRGAYSYRPVGGLDMPAILAQPVADTLFFAGEATSSAGQEATVHGAIASGRRAAREVLQQLSR